MNNVSPINTTIKYGAINGLVTFAFFALLWSIGKNPLGSWSVVGWAIPVVFTLLAIRDHRNKDLGGYITYGRGVSTGLLVAVFSGFLFSVLMYSFITFVAKNVPQMQLDDFNANMEKLKASGILSEDKIDSLMQKVEDSKSNFTAGNLALSSFESRIIGGLIISLIAAGIYTRKQPPFETTETTEIAPTNPS